MSDLLASDSDAAHFAVEYFCRQISGAIGSLAAKAGGIDALVFTGGIGEHAAQIRQMICAPLSFMGISLDNHAHLPDTIRIEAAGSKPVLIIPADEEAMIHTLCLTQL
jgi:acetate kinase